MWPTRQIYFFIFPSLFLFPTPSLSLLPPLDGSPSPAGCSPLLGGGDGVAGGGGGEVGVRLPLIRRLLHGGAGVDHPRDLEVVERRALKLQLSRTWKKKTGNVRKEGKE